MTVLCLALGIILGGVSAVILMAMFFVAKRADESEISCGLTSAVTHQESH